MAKEKQEHAKPAEAARCEGNDCVGGLAAHGKLAAQGVDWRLQCGDALALMMSLPNASIHLVAIDPPYFIDGMGADWDRKKLGVKTARAGVVGALPVGMQFDPRQGREFQRFMQPIAAEAMRVLKPGGYLVSFSQARLFHRMAVAVEDAGFEVRDMMAWKYSGQAKAFSMNHFIERMKNKSPAEKSALIEALDGWKTPQLRPQMEPIVLAQKPKDGTFLANWIAHKTGLINTRARLDDKFPGQILEFSKPSKAEKGADNEHLTVKPVRLMEHLIELLTLEGQWVLDAFVGSGTTGVAAINLKRKFVGFEIDPTYFSVAKRRIEEASRAGR